MCSTFTLVFGAEIVNRTPRGISFHDQDWGRCQFRLAYGVDFSFARLSVIAFLQVTALARSS